MNRLFSQQKALLELIAEKHGLMNDPSDGYDLTKGEIVKYIQEQLAFMSEEVRELILEIGGDKAIMKPWSVNYRVVANHEYIVTDKIKSEAIDMLCFCMNICLAAGITADNIDGEYRKVWDKNIKRQREGY